MTASLNTSPRIHSAQDVARVDTGTYVIAWHTELDAVREYWLGVFSQLRNPTLFQHIAWHEAFLRSRYNVATHGRTIFAVVSQEGRTLAVIPLTYHRSKRYGVPVRIVELLFPTDMGVRDFPLTDDANGGEILHALLNQALPSAGLPWDIAELPDLTTNSAAFTALQQLPTRRKLAIYHHDSNRLKCGNERSQCFAHVSKSHIKKTKRKRKSLDAVGNVECELITDFSALPQAFECFIELEDAGWKGKDKTSLRHDLPQNAFYESLINNRSSALNCCVAIMRLDGRPIAVNLCTRIGDTLWMLKITYADELHDYSPGNLILLYLLEYFAEDNGIEYISFITGGEWTWRWHPERIAVQHGTVFNRSLTGRLIKLLTLAKSGARALKQKWIASRTSAPAATADNHTNESAE